jgi:hypothetical protein
MRAVEFRAALSMLSVLHDHAQCFILLTRHLAADKQLILDQLPKYFTLENILSMFTPKYVFRFHPDN